MSTNPCLGEPFVDQDGRSAWYSADGIDVFRRADNGRPAAFNAPDGGSLFVHENPAARPPLARIEVQRPKRDWPALGAAAYHGLVGDIVHAIEPATEADPAAVLASILIYFGNALGRTAYAEVGTKRHSGNEFLVLVGDTSKGRKGTALDYVRALFDLADETWLMDRVATGLSSGEGLIYAVRDPSERRDKDGQILDEGVVDKRLLVVEEEFAATLKVAGRDGSTLSAQIRQAWDGGDLRVLSKNAPIRATGAHISIIGHITATELQRALTETEAGNGFANRFLWMCCRRSKLLPDGGGSVDLEGLAPRLCAALDFAKRCAAPTTRDPEARAMWHAIYPSLSEGRPGLLGAVTSRAEAHVLRLGLLYALLDRSTQIRAPHLRAALALWEYCEASVRYVFGDRLGDPIADGILELLTDCGDVGADRTQISAHFGRHLGAARLEASLRTLLDNRAIREMREATEGRPRTVYVLPDTP